MAGREETLESGKHYLKQKKDLNVSEKEQTELV
jgi:hypothetical protein